MPVPNALSLHCSKCKISGTCPKRGASPLRTGPRSLLLCRVLGGYARRPVDQSKLSPESKDRSAKDGPCMSIAEVPVVDMHSGLAHFEVVKVFHQAVVHPRERSTVQADGMLTRSHAQDAPRRTRS
jgi:hypothetical protein